MSGYPDWYGDDPECGHEEYDVDILDWECRCTCGHHWPASEDQVNAEIEFMRNSDVNIERENRRQWWRDKTYPVRMFFFRLLERVWPRKAINLLHDDEIPF